MNTTEKPIGEMTLIEIKDFMTTNTQPATPETDDHAGYCDAEGGWHNARDGHLVYADFARKMEREKNAALRELEELRKESHRLGKGGPMTTETRICPMCARDLQIDTDKVGHQQQCECGATLTLEWERLETTDGPEDLFYFSISEPTQ